MAYNKYYVYKEQVSRDNGLTWSYTGNETPSGDSIGTYDTLAECEEPQYRTISGTPYCTGYDKYVDVYSQVSYDAGVTWETTATTPTLIEANSEDCGYVPPTPTGTKFSATYSGGQTYSVTCNSITLTSGDTKPSGYIASAMTSAVIGDCVREIYIQCFENCYSLTSVTIPNTVTRLHNYAFDNCTSLTSITIPNSVTSIDKQVFAGCSSLTAVTIPSGVTSIGYEAFEYCSGLISFTCLPTTPPTLTDNLFFKASNCPIYVPAASVDAYKAANRWSNYADRIQPIP